MTHSTFRTIIGPGITRNGRIANHAGFIRFRRTSVMQISVDQASLLAAGGGACMILRAIDCPAGGRAGWFAHETWYARGCLSWTSEQAVDTAPWFAFASMADGTNQAGLIHAGPGLENEHYLDQLSCNDSRRLLGRSYRNAIHQAFGSKKQGGSSKILGQEHHEVLSKTKKPTRRLWCLEHIEEKGFIVAEHDHGEPYL